MGLAWEKFRDSVIDRFWVAAVFGFASVVSTECFSGECFRTRPGVLR